MPKTQPPVDDELLFRALTGVATEREREAVAEWRRDDDANQLRYRELELILMTLAAGEAAFEVPAPPPVETFMGRAASEPGSALPIGRRRPATWAVASLSAATVALGFAALQYWARPLRQPTFGGEQIGTASESRTVTLRDSTRVILGPDSRLRTELRSDEREVWLVGRAEFTVAPRPGLKFRVHTSGGDASDLGTRFVVRVSRSRMQLAVFEGRVAVMSGGASAEAGAGELVTTIGGGRPQVVRIRQAHTPGDWVRAALVFEATPLTEVAAAIEQHYGVQVRVPRALAGRTVTAWFIKEPTVGQVLTAICRAVGAKCTIGDTVAVFSS